MKRKSILMLIITFFLFGVAGLVIAGQTKCNPRKGKYLFRKNCRVCHKPGVTGEMAGKPLSPSSKTQAQWKRVFKKRNRLKCADEWKKLTEQDIQDILAYLHDHAYDSPSPAKCQ